MFALDAFAFLCLIMMNVLTYKFVIIPMRTRIHVNCEQLHHISQEIQAMKGVIVNS